jgi:hypothetical protein
MSIFFVILDISQPRNRAIMALLLLRFTDSDYPFGIFKRFLPFLTLCLNVYQGGNQNPYIEEQTTQWPTEKEQKDIDGFYVYGSER